MLNNYIRHAQYSLGDYAAAASAYRRGLDLDPSSASLKSGLQSAEARIVPGDDGPPPLISDEISSSTSGAPAPAGAGMGGMADMLRNMGGPGGAGGGGMPDIATLMNNPGMMAMAQQMMANGGLESLMQNPAVANMVNPLLSRGIS